MTFIPTGSQALRHFADTLDQQADRLDRLLWRDRGQRSTTAEAYQSQRTRFRTIIIQTKTGSMKLLPFTSTPPSLLQGAI